jgi:hypothetical protein
MDNNLNNNSLNEAQVANLRQVGLIDNSAFYRMALPYAILYKAFSLFKEQLNNFTNFHLTCQNRQTSAFRAVRQGYRAF